MNRDQMEGKWMQIKGAARKMWGQLTDDDLDQVHGSWEKLVGRIQERYGYQRERAEREVDNFLNRHPSPTI